MLNKYPRSSLIIFTVCLTACMTKMQVDHVKLGNEYAKDGLLREAITSYKNAIKNDMRRYQATRNLGIVQVKLGDYEKAIENLKFSLLKYPNNYQNNFYLGEAQRALGDFDNAIYSYKSALNVRPRDFNATKALAWSYYKIKYLSAALKTINEVGKKYVQHPQTLLIKARILLKQNYFSNAEKLTKKILRYKDKTFHPFALSILGDIQLQSGNPQEAEATYLKAIEKQPYLAGALFGLGKVYNQKNRFTKASSYLSRTIHLKPTLTEAYFEMGKSLENINPRKALVFLNKFMKRSAGHPELADKNNLAIQKIRKISRAILKRKHSEEKPKKYSQKRNRKRYTNTGPLLR